MNQTTEMTTTVPATHGALMPRVDIAGLLDKAIDAKSAVEVIRELRAMALEDEKRRAEIEFNAALSEFQTKCPPISKSRAVPDRNGNKAYGYAPLENIEEVIRPIERDCGFTHVFGQDTASQPGWVISTCTIKHRAGHEQMTASKFPLGTKTQIMSDTQVYASALTFANRRTLVNAYGLVLVGEDKDGVGSTQKPASVNANKADNSVKPLVEELWALLATVRGTDRNWVKINQYLWREEILDGAIPEQLPRLPAERLNQVIAAVKKLQS